MSEMLHSCTHVLAVINTSRVSVMYGAKSCLSHISGATSCFGDVSSAASEFQCNMLGLFAEFLLRCGVFKTAWHE